MTNHTEHIEVTVWSMDCIDGDCEHVDEEGMPDDLSTCPSSEMEACVDCMVERGYPADPGDGWEGAIAPWPHREPAPPLVPHGPEPEPAIFKRSWGQS